jgi:N6-adenosine-specific RNA methylase IME4
VRKAIKQGARQAREAELGDAQAAGNLALPTKRYGVILADPEWRFEPYSRETGIDRAADNHYPTSPLDVIKARDVPSISADDCVLFLWATAPMLPEALEVLKAWGFDYRSQIIWHKERIGTGYWFRNEHELLLVGTRGNIPAPAMGTQWRSLCASPSGVHSEKPGWQYELIEAYFPTLSKIELNARRARPGWDCWGVEAPPHVEAIAPPQVATGRMKWLSIKKLEADIDELPLDENGVPLQPAWWDGSADEWFELVEFKGCPPAKTPDLPSTT